VPVIPPQHQNRSPLSRTCLTMELTDHDLGAMCVVQIERGSRAAQDKSLARMPLILVKTRTN
jgi:hypothetical protein